MGKMTIISLLSFFAVASAQSDCPGLYSTSNGAPVQPMDVCLASSVSGVVTSSKYSCDGNAGMLMQYDGANCVGDAVSSTPVTGFTTVCDGGCTFDYVVLRSFGGNSGACTDDYTDAATIVNQCVAEPLFGISIKATCSSSKAFVTSCDGNGCSTNCERNEATLICSEIVTCSGAAKVAFMGALLCVTMFSLL